MEVSCVVIELKPGSTARVREWALFIRANKEEALATLKGERVTIESFFLTEIASKGYLICYMRAQCMEYAHQAVKRSLSAVDAYHQQFKKDTWAGGTEAELMFDLSRMANESGFA